MAILRNKKNSASCNKSVPVALKNTTVMRSRSKRRPRVFHNPGTVVEDQPHNMAAEDQPHHAATKHANKKARGSWREEDMLEAMDRIDDGDFLTIKDAAKHYGIPYSSMRNWYSGVYSKKAGKNPKCLTKAEEDDLVDWSLRRVSCGLGVTKDMLKHRVETICADRITLFKNGKPGEKWWRLFKRRHNNLSLRSTETLDVARARAMNPTILRPWFSGLEEIYSIFNFDPTHIWNADETGIQAGKVKGMKVIAKKGVNAVHEMVMKNREWVTVLVCANASGEVMPSYYIFKGSRIRGNHVLNCEPGAGMSVQPSAWMTSELFKLWITEHFQSKVPGGISPENPHLLILDGHGSHVEDDVILLARSIGLHLMILPPHTSHKLQPLDVAVFGPFKKYFRRERAKWMASKPKVEPTKADLGKLICDSMRDATCSRNILAGFKATGLWPFNDAVIDKLVTPAVDPAALHLPEELVEEHAREELHVEVGDEEEEAFGPYDQEAYMNDEHAPNLQGIEIIMGAHGAGPSRAAPVNVIGASPLRAAPFNVSGGSPSLAATINVTGANSQQQVSIARRSALPDLSKVGYVTSDQFIRAVEEEKRKKAEDERNKQQKLEEKKREMERKKKLKEVLDKEKQQRKEEREMKKRLEEQEEASGRRLRALLYGNKRPQYHTNTSLHQPPSINTQAKYNRQKRMEALRISRLQQQQVPDTPPIVAHVEQVCPHLHQPQLSQFNMARSEDEMDTSQTFLDSQLPDSMPGSPLVGCSLEDTHICSQDIHDQQLINVSIGERISANGTNHAQLEPMHEGTQAWIDFANQYSEVGNSEMPKVCKARWIRRMAEAGVSREALDRAKKMDEGWAKQAWHGFAS